MMMFMSSEVAGRPHQHRGPSLSVPYLSVPSGSVCLGYLPYPSRSPWTLPPSLHIPDSGFLDFAQTLVSNFSSLLCNTKDKPHWADLWLGREGFPRHHGRKSA